MNFYMERRCENKTYYCHLYITRVINKFVHLDIIWICHNCDEKNPCIDTVWLLLVNNLFYFLKCWQKKFQSIITRTGWYLNKILYLVLIEIFWEKKSINLNWLKKN